MSFNTHIELIRNFLAQRAQLVHAIQALLAVGEEVLDRNTMLGWTGEAYQLQAGAGTGPVAFALGLLFVFLILVNVVLILIGAAMFASTLGSTGDDPETQKAGATRACQDWVRDKLKSPSTATFPGSPTVTGSGPWVITGQVDAQNALGGTLREDWTCNVRLDGDTFRGSATITG